MKHVGKKLKAQTAVEYLLLLGLVTAFVLIVFKQYMPKVTKSSEYYFNRSTNQILGPPPFNEVDWVRMNYP